MSDQTLTPLRLKKLKSIETSPRRRFSFSTADTSKHNAKISDGNKNSPQFTRLLSPKHWRIRNLKNSERNNSTSSLPDRIQQNTTPATLDPSKPCALRVYASDLHPDILYKTITISAGTTAVEALQLLLNKYAADEDDKDCSIFNLAEVCDSPKGNYSRFLNDDECPIHVQCGWVTASEWSFWLIRKEPAETFEFRPSRYKEIEVPVDVSYLNKECFSVSVEMSDDSSSAEIIKIVLAKCKLPEESCYNYCLWEMIGVGNQMTGNPLMANEKVLRNKKLILSGEGTLFLRPRSSDTRGGSPANLDTLFSDCNNLSYAWTPKKATQRGCATTSLVDDEEIISPPWINKEIPDELSSVASTASEQSANQSPLVTEIGKLSQQCSGLPKAIKKDANPKIMITASGSINHSAEESNSTASETLQISNSLTSSTTEVDVAQEARSPCLSNPIRVHIQYPCSLYCDPNYLPPKQLSAMIGELIKDGMPRLMRKIVAETKLAHRKPENIFNFDVLPLKQSTTQLHLDTDMNSSPNMAKQSFVLSKPPQRGDASQTLSSDNTMSSDSEMEDAFSGNKEADQQRKKSVTLPRNVTNLAHSNKLQRSHSLMSERRRMDILRNMSQSVKDRLRSRSSSAATPPDLSPTSINSTPTSATPTGSRSSSPTKSYSVNVTISCTSKRATNAQAIDKHSVSAPKNKVRRWISFNYGDKSKSKTAQKYMKRLEQKGIQ